MSGFRFARVFALPALLLLFAGHELLAAEARRPLSFSDLLDLAGLGLEPAVISAQIEKLGLDFEPTPRQLAALREAGLSPDVLSVILRDIDLKAGPHVPAETVRIYRQPLEDGRVALVLTNLDEQGNRLIDPEDPGVTPLRPPAPPATPGCTVPEESKPAEARAPEQAPTVVVNVEAPPPSPPVFGFPYVAVGGVVGPYEYPLPLPFLGYGNGISTPGWFSGLGLNAANNFGHRPQDKPNTTGLGAFFGPPSH